jgi:Raf kinase inhibitor-like YbhB/YbcL family protein
MRLVVWYILCGKNKNQFYMFTLISIIMNAMLTVTSPAFGANTMIPIKYTCEGASVSPALHIGEFPAQTKSLAIILHDPDAGRPGGFTHWVVFNIDPMADIPEGYKGGVQAMNGAHKAGYIGPCPPTGVHHYHFMVYALDTRLDLGDQAGKAELEKAMEGHILAQGDLVGLYKKTK